MSQVNRIGSDRLEPMIVGPISLSFICDLSRRLLHKLRLSKLRILLLSYYFELHDLLMLVSMMKGSYKIKLPIKSNTKPNDNILFTNKKILQ